MRSGRTATWQSLVASGFTMNVRAIIAGTTYTAITAPVIDRALCGDGLKVGNCNEASLQFAVKTTNAIPKAAQVEIQIQLYNGSTNTGWLTMGKFFIDSREESNGMIQLQCYDAMLKANQAYVDHTDPQSRVGWPKTMSACVTEIAQRIGVSLDSRNIIKTGTAYQVAYPETLSMRDVLGYIGACHGGNWIITQDNKLRLVPLASLNSSTLDTVSLSFCTGIHKGAQSTISRVTITADADTGYTNGTDTGVELLIENVPYANQTICNALYTALNGAVYQKVEVTGACFDPAAELGDKVTISSTYGSMLMYSTHEVLGKLYRCDISSPGDEESNSEYPYLTTIQKLTNRTEILQKYQEQTTRTVSSITQTMEDITMSVEEIQERDESQLLEGTKDYRNWTGSLITSSSVNTGEAGASKSGETSDKWIGMKSPTMPLGDNWKGRKLTLSFDVKSPNWAAVEAGDQGGITAHLHLIHGSDDYAINRYNIIKTGGKWGVDTLNYVTDTAIVNNVYQRPYVTFTLPTSGNYDSFYITIFLRRNGNVTFRRVKAEWGALATVWGISPNDPADQLKCGSTVEIDKDHVMIQTQLFEVKNTDTQGTEMLKVNPEGVKAQNIITDTIQAPVVKYYRGPATVNVSSYAALAAWCADAKDTYFPFNVVVVIPNSVTWNGSITLRGTSGNSITFRNAANADSSHPTLNGQVNFQHCTNVIYWNYINVNYGGSTSYTNGVFNVAHSTVHFNKCNITAGSGGNGIYASLGSRVSVNTVTFNGQNAGYCGIADSASVIGFTACKGYGKCGSGDRTGFCTVNSNSTMPCPSKTVSTWEYTAGAAVFGTPTSCVDTGGVTPVTTREYTAKATAAYRVARTGDTWDWTSSNVMRQGCFWEDGQTVRYYGVAKFEVPAMTGTVKNVTLTIQRNSGGSTRSVAIKGYLTTNWGSGAIVKGTQIVDGTASPATQATMATMNNFAPAQNTSVYVVFDPGDTLLAFGSSESANTAMLSITNDATYLTITTG